MLSKQRGSFLIEALVSLLLIMGGILALVSLMSVSINQVSQTKYRTDASNLASEFIGEMYATWTGVNACPAAWGARVAAMLPGGALTNCDTSQWPLVYIEIDWNDKSGPQHKYLTSTTITK